MLFVGVLIGFLFLIVAAFFMFKKKLYAIGSCLALIGLIIAVGTMITSERMQKKIDAIETPSPATETPYVTETPYITETPFVTETPEITNTPEITCTPLPTETPSPTPTATPSPSPSPTNAYLETHYDETTIVKPQNWNGKTIYLTFDDGPSNSTKRVLDNMKKYNVKVTFFVIGTALNNNTAVTKRAIDEGHAVGIHAYSHTYSEIYASVDAFKSDFDKMIDLMHTKLNYNPTISRFPGGTSNMSSYQYCKGIMTKLKDLVPSWGVEYVDWNVSPEDAMSKMTVDQIFEATKKEISKKSATSIFVLMHDFGGMDNSADAALKIVEWGLENGYAFDRITPETKNLCRHSAQN